MKDESPLLIAQTGGLAGQRWLVAKDEMLIGRDATCDIVVADRQISRQHARVGRDEFGYYVEDLGSKNGTYVNGSLITGRARLQDGDLIQVALALDVAFVGSEATLPLSMDSAQPARTGVLRLDVLSRRVWVRGREVDPPLSVPQYRLLELLYQKSEHVCSRDEIVSAVWPEASGTGVSEQAIDALVRRLRDRLAEVDRGHQFIVTVRGHGFRLVNPSA